MPFVKFEQLPAGVTPLKDYRSLGATLVECRHHPDHITPLALRGSDITPLFCRICRTLNPDPDRPVKLIALVPAGQPSLF